MHLWEVDHPYYCSETNYFATADRTVTEYESWADFTNEWRDFDVDMNLVFRWDWRTPDPQDYGEGEVIPECDELAIFRMGQRKGLFTCQLVSVTKDDETAVREYLQPHLDRLMENWYPMLPSST